MAAQAGQQGTGTVAGARADARAQGGGVADAMPYLPASSTPYPPPGADPATLTWAETVAGGNYTHKVLARGTRIRLEDVTGEACAHVLLYNALEPWERLNVADTVKIPWQAYLTTGHPLLSGDGRVLATIVKDDSQRHDALCGTSTAPGRHLFTLAAAKHGLSAKGPAAIGVLLQGDKGKPGRRPGLHRKRRPRQGRRTARRAPADHPHSERAAPRRPKARTPGRTPAGARLAIAADQPG